MMAEKTANQIFNLVIKVLFSKTTATPDRADRQFLQVDYDKKLPPKLIYD